ncbi:hypothetical protein, partial [Vibrio owensii]|uniref:hypothetical protein n=1 Tax=Vibrio owensii TaxID=696485 RepID=UPI00391BFD14
PLLRSLARNSEAFFISDVCELDGICINSEVSRDLGLIVLELSHYEESPLKNRRVFVASGACK